MLAPGNNSSTLEAVKALGAEIAAAATEGEEKRSLQPALVDKLQTAGIFRMLVPKRYDGDALTVPQACAVIEELASHDAPAAWTAMVAYGFNVALARLPRATVDQIYARGPNVRTRGALAPIGAAIPCDGGYRVSGRWPFASGPYQPEWVVAGAVVLEHGKPRMGPNGPETRLLLVAPEKVEFIDTWYTVGLCGTDSRDYQIKDAFVPESHAMNLFDFSAPQAYGDPLFNLPFPVLTGPTHSAVCLGIARASLDELCTIARTKRSAFNPAQTLGENMVFQHRLAELAVRHAAIESLLDRQTREVMRLGAGEMPFGPEVMARHASWTGYMHVQAMDIVNEVFTLAGSTPVYTRSSLQRRWRDVRVAAQHFGGSTVQYPNYGASLVGIAPQGAPEK